MEEDRTMEEEESAMTPETLKVPFKSNTKRYSEILRDFDKLDLSFACPSEEQLLDEDIQSVPGSEGTEPSEHDSVSKHPTTTHTTYTTHTTHTTYTTHTTHTTDTTYTTHTTYTTYTSMRSRRGLPPITAPPLRAWPRLRLPVDVNRA
ncbi:hypothetical protein CRUP_015489 [Coryphaenoides rupestris]|nr:hypothetical protein CRUP_015489 [Coryphaenoides rupestris]